MTPELKAFAGASQNRIEQVLSQLLDHQTASEPQLLAAMRYSLLGGGKRIRPLLAYASASAVGDISAATDHVAAALESIHAYSLVHDDLPAMDDDDLRRGQPTCHIAFGEAAAVLAGDGLQSLAFAVLASAPGVSADIRLQLILELARAAGPEGMVAGQAIDLAAVNHQLTLPQLQHMHALKTGALIRASVHLGALATGRASDTQLQQLGRYADAIGLAFQVQDDILDVTTDTGTLGKRQGADLALNKPTYVSLLGLDGARDKCRQLLEDSLQALRDFDQRADHLRQLARYIVERNK